MNKLLAIDIGGTFIKFGILKESGEVIETFQRPTPETLEQFLLLIKEIRNEYTSENLLGLAVSSPGNPTEEGFIEAYSAVPYIHGINMKQLLEEELELAVTITNDANCAALAEKWKGNAQDAKNVSLVVIGTGIGGSLLQNGELYKGHHLHAGDVGYLLLPDPETGSFHTFSRLASTSSIIRNVAKWKAEDEENWTGEKVFDFAHKGDEICQRAVDRFYRMLAFGLYNIQYTYDPELILLGGGISSRSDLIDNINQRLVQLQSELDESPILPTLEVCYYQSNANLLGAAYYFLRSREML